MPNGGFHYCHNCLHFAKDQNRCTLRGEPIALPYRTMCRNFNEPNATVRGPLYSMVGEAQKGMLYHLELPYYDGCRPETVQPTPGGDTVVRLEANGTTREFRSSEEYFRFYAASGRDV